MAAWANMGASLRPSASALESRIKTSHTKRTMPQFKLLKPEQLHSSLTSSTQFAMFSRAIVIFYFALAMSLLAAAMPGGAPPPVTTTVTVTAPASAPTGGNVCSTGSVQCCNSVGKVCSLTRVVGECFLNILPS